MLLLDLAQTCAGTYAPGAVPRWQGRDEKVHVYLSIVRGIPTIAFEGTTAWEERSALPEWLIDFDAAPVTSPHDAYGRVHQGMAGDVSSVIDMICTYLGSQNWPRYYVTGHSKGAGEATLFHAEMKYRGHPPLSTRAYEPPQVGGHALRDYMSGEDYDWTVTKNVHGRDVVTLVPGGLQIPFVTEWSHINHPLVLTVPDTYDLATKHRIPAVIEAITTDR